MKYNIIRIKDNKVVAMGLDTILECKETINRLGYSNNQVKFILV